MLLAGGPECLRARRRMLVAAWLVSLLVVALVAGAAAVPAQAHPEHPHGPGDSGQNQPWDDPDSEPDWDGDDGDPADEEPGGAAAEPVTPVPPQPTPDTGGTSRWRDDPAPATGGTPLGNEDAQPAVEELAPVTSTFVSGTVARMRIDGKAAIPRGAPKRVRTLISHYNRIAGMRYKWGGGHAKLVDRGYDCSGAVGYGLIKTGLQTATMVSASFTRWGAAGAGRWVSVYANKGHVYLEVAGLRLDTSAVGDDRRRKGVRWRPVVGQRNGFKARHPLGL